MATNVQGSASSIGMAPSTGGAPSAGALPSLTGGTEGAATDPTATTGLTGGVAGTDPTAAGTAGGATPAAGAGIMGMAKHGQWLGPLLTIGGGVAALAAFKNPNGSALMKFGGISAALSGVGLTAIGFRAKGIEAGTAATTAEAQAAMVELDAQYKQAMQNMSTEATTAITGLKQQLAAQQAQAQQQVQQPGVQTPGAPGAGGEMTVGPGLDSTVVPGTGQQVPVGQDGQATQGSGGSTPTTGTQTAGAWSVQSLMGKSIEVAAGASPSGTAIADQGIYRIEATPGDPNGYATLEEANAVARESMNTELMGSKFLRWMVVEHGGRFYAAVAKQLPEGVQPEQLDPAVGNVVAWSAMNHVTDNGVYGWQAYSWTQSGGGQSMAVPYGTSNVYASVSGGGPVGSAPGGSGSTTGGGATLPGTNIPVPGGTTPGGTVTGGTVSAAPFDPASQVGRTFAINASNTAEGDLARGGVLQVQRFVESSAGGFGTAEEAATAARAARKAAGGGDQWSRWVSMQGADGRFYVYEGSIVKRPTAEVEAAPVHVFGVGFSEFFDGTTNAWKAVRDAA